jgi:hypothetical protein
MLSENERRIKILNFVKDNSIGLDKKPILKITKSDVMRHLKDVRPMTTHKTTVELIKEGKINMIKKEPYSQTDYLILNEDNEFNKIYNWLTEIDKIIDSMILPIENLEIFERYEPKHMERVWVEKLRDHFATAYICVYCMLEILLIHISQKIKSQKDSWSLYNRMVELKIKINQQKPIFHIEGLGLYWKKTPLIVANPNGLKHIDEEYRRYSESQGIPIYELTSNLISRIENFKTQFLYKEDK